MCIYCLNILGIKAKQHGYGLSEQQAKELTKDKQIADYFEQAVHYVVLLK